MSYFEQANADNAISRPHLIWVIQNFRLQLTQENGEEITGREWIEKLLQQVDQSNNGTSAFRKQFNEFFSSLHMKTLPYPVKTVDDLHSLSSLKSSQLDSKYRQAVSELKDQIKQLAEPKRIGKLRMTGTALAALVAKWTENINLPIGDYRNSAEELLSHIM